MYMDFRDTHILIFPESIRTGFDQSISANLIIRHHLLAFLKIFIGLKVVLKNF